MKHNSAELAHNHSDRNIPGIATYTIDLYINKFGIPLAHSNCIAH